MRDRMVLARAYLGEPAKMVEVGRRPGVVFLSNPDLLSRVEANQIDPIGFPEEDIFAFDAELYDRLRSEWEQGQQPPSSWKAATPLPN